MVEAKTPSLSSELPDLQPLPLGQAFWLFAIPSLLINLGLYGLFPWLRQHHYPESLGFLVGLVLPLAILLIAAMVGYGWEGRPFHWSALQQRFRLYPLDTGGWLWSLGLFAFTLLWDQLLGFTSIWLLNRPWMSFPDFLPTILDPRHEMAIPEQFFGFSLPGNWWVLGLQMGVLVVNILGEELWWRGYILPRQERVHQHRTWIIHGLLWTGFHSFWYWNLIRLLPTCLAYAYVAQRLKNTTPTLVAHALGNGLGIIPTVLGILGVSME